MFTWICPMCGRECPPSYTECPDCAQKKKAAPAEPQPAGAAPPPVATAPAPPPPPAASIVQPLPAPLPRSPQSVPAWAVTLIVALVLIIVGGGLYYFISSRRPVETAAATAAPATQFETPPVSSHPYSKYIELAGFRITENAKRQAQIRFLIVNHSAAELASVPIHVTLTTTKAKPEDPPVAAIDLKTPRLAAYESQEMVSTIRTKLRAYELPDWQFLRTSFEIADSTAR